MTQDLTTDSKRACNKDTDAKITLEVDVIRSAGSRNRHLNTQASGICVRIDGHRRRIEVAASAEQLLEILEALESEDLADGSEQFNIRVGRNRRQPKSVSQLLKEASDPKLSSEEREHKLGKVPAIQNQLVREKLERVEAIHRELKSVSADTQLSDVDKKLAVEGILTKALNNGLISESEHQNFIKMLGQPDGINNVVKIFGAKLSGLQNELRTTAIFLRNSVEEVVTSSSSAPIKGVMLVGEPGFKPPSASIATPIQQQIISYTTVVNSIGESPKRKTYTQILTEALDQYCEEKRKIELKAEAEEQAQEEQDKKAEIARLKEVFFELQGQIPGLRISDIQVVLASLENMSHAGLRQLVLNMKNMYGSDDSASSND
jgi:hypothetical protein